MSIPERKDAKTAPSLEFEKMLSKLLAGSEGTLAFTTAIKLNLIPLPPGVKCVVPAHFSTLEDALYANILVLKHHPSTIELMDDIIMNCTKENLSQIQQSIGTGLTPMLFCKKPI